MLKLLESNRGRILIGDDVGLGKTIEAGYILTELEAGRQLDCVLIVAPARLRTKWKSELEERFGQKFEAVRAAGLRVLQDPARAPSHFRWIVSYETARGCLEVLKESGLSLDLLVFDEAHRLRSPTTLQHRTGALLCERAETVVMLTATPIQTGLADLYHLARLLLPDEFDDQRVFGDQMSDNQALLAALQAMRGAVESDSDRGRALDELDRFLASASGRAFAAAPVVADVRTLLAGGPLTRQALAEMQATLGALSPLSHFFTRTRKVEAIPNTARRHAQWIRVELAGVEKEIYETIVAACRAAAGGGFGADQSKIMVYRAVASCIPAAMRHFRDEVRGAIRGVEDAPGEDDESDEAVQAVPKLGDLEGALRAAVGRASALFERLGATDSKLDALVTGLRELWREDAEAPRRLRKVLVFSYFRGTVEYLHQQLERRSIVCASVHGGVPVDERESRIDAFREDQGPLVLVTSDVSAEGVDLQMASVVFNYDLPWNPMLVEQRVGRIDRIGQAASVLVIANLVVEGSIEERILARLFQRVQLFEACIGEMEALLGGVESVPKLTQRALLGTLSEEELEAQLELAGQAFENQRRAAAELDARAGELLAADQALVDEIRAATGEHQIPTEKHLLAFVNHALHRAVPGLVIPEMALKQPVTVDLGAALATKPLDGGHGESDRDTQFMRWARNDSIKLTFSREAAYRHPAVTLVHAAHPLVRWAALASSEVHHAFALQRRESTVLPPGRYLVAVSYFGSRASHGALRMIGAVTAVGSSGAVDLDTTDFPRLVGELLEQGGNLRLPWSGEPAPAELEGAIEGIRSHLDLVSATQARRERELHTLRTAARHGRQRAGFQAALDRAEVLLAKYLREQAGTFAVRMQEKKVQKARERLEAYDARPAHQGWEEPERQDVAVGYLEVGESV